MFIVFFLFAAVSFSLGLSAQHYDAPQLGIVLLFVLALLLFMAAVVDVRDKVMPKRTEE